MTTKYEKQRAHRTPPHAPLRNIRQALGLTLEEVRERMVVLDHPISKGHLSAIEGGLRGASQAQLLALSQALGLGDSLTTNYEPRRRDVAA